MYPPPVSEEESGHELHDHTSRQNRTQQPNPRAAPRKLGLDTLAWLPDRYDHGIAVVGCGGIVNDGHLPAYTSHGLNVVGCFDINLEAAQRTAERWNIERVFTSLEEVASDPSVEITDIAVPAWRQLETVRTLADAGKHLLCQKPLSDDFVQAVEIVRRAEAAGVKLAVNQQYRWSPVVRAMHTLIAQGRIGTATAAFVHESMANPWQLWPWLMEVPQLEVMYHSIHYLDGLRFLLGDHGEPEWVTSRHTRHPQQTPSAETKTITILDYPDGLQAFVAVDHNDRSDDVFGRVRVLGTTGVASGTMGLSYDYPSGRPDTVRWSAHDDPGGGFEIDLPGRWIPEGFVGPISSLMSAINDDAEPATSGRDNLKTLRLVHAAYRSAAENRSVSPLEIAADR